MLRKGSTDTREIIAVINAKAKRYIEPSTDLILLGKVSVARINNEAKIIGRKSRKLRAIDLKSKSGILRWKKFAIGRRKLIS